MPWDMIMSLPIQDRRDFIRRHNAEQEALKKEYNSNGGQNTIGGEQLNEFARMEQSNRHGGKPTAK